MKVMNKMKLRKATGPSEVNMDMIMASGKFGVIRKKLFRANLMVKICQRNGKRVLLFQSLKERRL